MLLKELVVYAQALPVSSESLQQFHEETAKDLSLQVLIQVVPTGKRSDSTRSSNW